MKVHQFLKNQVDQRFLPRLHRVARVLLREPLGRYREEMRQEWQERELRIVKDLSDRLLSTRDALANRWKNGSPAPDKSICQPASRSLDEDLGSLRKEFPGVFPVWLKLFENARTEYETDPKNSLSVEGNEGAEAFRKYLAPEVRGRVLDIGCGPQAFPSYLQGFESVRIAGIDPLPGVDQRRFQFVRGIAEFLPWPDGEFDLAIAATSLDHTISLDMAFSEIGRVLSRDGIFVVWVGFVAGAPKYDPHAASVEPIDAFHIFHFDRPWFIELISRYFVVVDEFKLDNMNHFFTLRPIR
jgi:SAM-dependent methyltransferase